MSTLAGWPVFGLVITTPRLELRLSTDGELDSLATRAVGQVLVPEEAHFLGSGWTQVPSPRFERDFLAYHWGCRSRWTPENWRLPFGVFPQGATEAVGVMDLAATDYAALREVRTGSWLLDSARGRGWGLEMRRAVLHLAFDHLGAVRARSEAAHDNAASHAVSARIGYRTNGSAFDAWSGVSRETIRLVFDRADWQTPADFSVTGLDACRDRFGA